MFLSNASSVDGWSNMVTPDPLANDEDDPKLRERLTDAFLSYFKGKGDCGSRYGLQVTKVSSDGSVIFLTMTLLSGTRYCCSEPGCHIGLHQPEDFQHLRAHLTAGGCQVSHPITLHVRWEVEVGALLDLNRMVGRNELVDHAWAIDEIFAEADVG